LNLNKLMEIYAYNKYQLKENGDKNERLHYQYVCMCSGACAYNYGTNVEGRCLRIILHKNY